MSADGSRIFFTVDGKLMVVQPDRKLLSTLSENAVKSFHLQIGDRILWGEQSGAVKTTDLDEFESATILTAGSNTNDTIKWCGDWIAVENAKLEWVTSSLEI